MGFSKNVDIAKSVMDKRWKKFQNLHPRFWLYHACQTPTLFLEKSMLIYDCIVSP